MELFHQSIGSLHEKLKRRDVSAREVLRSFMGRIEQVEGRIGAYNRLCFDEAGKAADEADRRLSAGEDTSPLLGIPLAVKDNICTRHIGTTCSSRILADFVPDYDATAVKRLKSRGAVLIGKTSMDEFAMGSSTENTRFKITRNPWHPGKVPGGSSGGSAAAVAAGEAAGALGSDTGGSVRHPAAFCGVTGLKPTYGAVSRFGLVAFASSMDQIGPIARDVADCALLMEAMAGRDPLDATTADAGVPDYVSFLGKNVIGLRMGVPKEYFASGLGREVAEAVRQVIRAGEDLGMTPVDISLPHTAYAIAAYYLVNTAEASANLARYDGVRYGFRSGTPGDIGQMYRATRDAGFGPEVKRRIMLGAFALSAGYYDAYYLKAQKVRTLIQRDFSKAFDTVDIIVTPTAPTTAFDFGEKTEEPLQMYLSDVYTSTANLAGIPALSIPCGLDGEGLPIGVQIMGPHFGEGLLFQAGYALEQVLPFRGRKPPMDFCH
jgi:aspartyl-tRNA(Asn)/glutamyl-tRNA(Gln) amidotransferase subunit A